jgi:hypothetical protein
MAMHLWRGRWSADAWRAHLDAGVIESKFAAIGHSTYSGRPLGSAEFTRTLGKKLDAAWRPKNASEEGQTSTP